MKNINEDNITCRRQAWIRVLSQANSADLEKARKNFSEAFDFRYITPPETGLLMVEARADGNGAGFNLGEIAVTKCVIELDSLYLGFGCIVGTDTLHAELAALFDGLLQNPDHSRTLMETLIEPLMEKQADMDRATEEKTAGTRVEFFTMQRGE